MSETEQSRNFTGRICRLLIPAVLLTVLDQLSKAVAAERLINGPVVLIQGAFELRYLENRGAAFGILQNRQLVFVILTAVILLGVGLFYLRLPYSRRFLPLRVSCVVLTAGALGNLIDRLFFGYVRDFLYFRLIDFPVFNVADIYVTAAAFCGCILLIFIYREDELGFIGRKKGDG